MAPPKFHLGWFMCFVTDEWNTTFGSGGSPWDGRFYIEMAQAMERACFDYIMIEDTLMVADAYGGSMEPYVKHALMAPKGDPSPLAAIIAAATTKMGVVATLSTSFYPPYLLARLCSTLDGIAEGRFGWNIVTSGEDRAAQNFGLDKLYEHDLRYDMAEEYVDLVRQLFDSWEPGAVVLDRETGTYADYTKVHEINFEGKFYKSRGPLNTVRSPQGRPAFLQAGGSPKGRSFAARNADCILAISTGVEGMKEYRDSVRRYAEEDGRDPDEVKVMFIISPVLGETDEEARAKQRRRGDNPALIETMLAGMGSVTDIDFSQFDLDEPLPDDLDTNGERGSLEKFAQPGSGKTLRELIMDRVNHAGSIELVGTPETVAEQMGEAMEEVGGDGFLFTMPGFRLSRRSIAEITDGLVPALQRRGLVRTEYNHTFLRDTLREF